MYIYIYGILGWGCIFSWTRVSCRTSVTYPSAITEAASDNLEYVRGEQALTYRHLVQSSRCEFHNKHDKSCAQFICVNLVSCAISDNPRYFTSPSSASAPDPVSSYQSCADVLDILESVREHRV